MANVLNVLRQGIDSALLGLGKASVHDLTGDDVLVPPGFTRDAIPMPYVGPDRLTLSPHHPMTLSPRTCHPSPITHHPVIFTSRRTTEPTGETLRFCTVALAPMARSG